MIVQRFVKWCETASSLQRSSGVGILARAFAEGRVPPSEAGASLAALTHLLDDPSPKVRLAMAEALAEAPRAPRRLMVALAGDIDDIACLVAARSPVLSAADLVDLFAAGSPRLRAAIASRSCVPVKLSAAIAEVGDGGALSILLGNPGAAVAGGALRRAAERLGDDGEVRALLLGRTDLPVDVRQTLLLELGRALAEMPLVRHAVGRRRIGVAVFDACERATAGLAETLPVAEVPALVEHLRVTGQLSTAFLIRAVCLGNIDLFATSLVALSGLSERRVRSIVVEGREGPFDALLATCGFPPAAGVLLRSAINVWKQAASGAVECEIEEIPALVMSRLAAAFADRADEPGFEAVIALLQRLEDETARRSASRSVRRMAAA